MNSLLKIYLGWDLRITQLYILITIYVKSACYGVADIPILILEIFFESVEIYLFPFVFITLGFDLMNFLMLVELVHCKNPRYHCTNSQEHTFISIFILF